MRNILTSLILVVPIFLYIAAISHADVPASQKKEVEHLLEYVRTSDYKFERNGKLYDAERAYSHINGKYEYFIDDITSTETFIEYAATKSMMSGRYYMVRCKDSAPVKLADWLNEELERYRVMNNN